MAVVIKAWVGGGVMVDIALEDEIKLNGTESVLMLVGTIM